MIDNIYQFVSAHPLEWTAFILGAQYVFSALVDSLPEPVPMGSPQYRFAYTFVHKLAGNLSVKAK